MRIDLYTERHYEFEEPYKGGMVTITLKNGVPVMYEYKYKEVHKTLGYKLRWLYNMKYIGDIVNVWNEKRLLKRLEEVDNGKIN